MRRVAVLIALFLALGAATVIGAAFGAVSIAPATILDALLHPQRGGDLVTLLWSLRFPRLAIAALVGGALALAGTLMQDLLRNPLVDPYLTGASAGAAFAIAIAIALGVPPPLYSTVALAASLLTTIVVALLARTGTGLSIERLVVAGIALSSLFAGLTTLVIMWTPESAVSLNILAWLGGSLAGHGWRDLGWASLYALAGILVALPAVPALRALRLGAQRARALGTNLDRTRWIVVIASCLLTAAAVSVSGIIGFVGLIVPHVVRALIGHDPRWSIVAAVPAGATLVVLADTIARAAAPPAEIPLGILLSLLGVPAFLYLSTKKVRLV